MTEFKEFVLSLWANVYLRSLIIFLAGIAAAYISKFITRHYLKPLAKRTKTKIDDLIIKSISSVIFYIVFFLGLKIAVTNLPIPSKLIDTLSRDLAEALAGQVEDTPAGRYSAATSLRLFRWFIEKTNLRSLDML